MKTVLVVGADFVPSSLPPALRVRFLVRHLPSFGWKPIVLSTAPEFYEQQVDPENYRLLPADLEVIRTPAFRAATTRGFGLGDLGIRSLWHHWGAIRRICRTRKIDAIFIPVPPYVPMVLGRMAYQRFRIPYVVDFIDPWVTRYYLGVRPEQRPPKWRFMHYLARVLEPYAMRRVGHITGVSRGTVHPIVARYRWLSTTDETEIPYGGEPADFDYVRQNPRANRIFNRDDGNVHIVYVGAFIPAMHATARALFSAIKEGLRLQPETFAKLRLHFVGTSYARESVATAQVMPLARESGIDAVVTELPRRVAYLDALQLLLDSQATVVLGSDQPHYTASKLFPYIMARQPLLAIFHEQSNVVAILNQTRAGTALTFSAEHGPAARVEEIRAWLGAVISGGDSVQPRTDWQAFEQYTTRAMSERLATALDKAVERKY